MEIYDYTENVAIDSLLFVLTNDISIINGTPFLYIKSIKALILGDIHFGQEAALLNFKETSVSKSCIGIRKIVEEILGRIDVEMIILNGDIKHNTYFISKQEFNEIEYFFKSDLISKTKCIMIRGNHDRLLKFLIRKTLDRKLEIQDEISLSDYFIHHGHLLREPGDNGTIIISHEHPAYTFRGVDYGRVKLPAFVKLKTSDNKQIIIIPATNKISTGISFPPNKSNDFLSPYLREKVTIKRMQIYPFDPITGVLPLPPIDFQENY